MPKGKKQESPSTPAPVASSVPGPTVTVTSQRVAGNRYPKLEKYLQELEGRNKLQLGANFIAGIVGSIYFGLLTALVSFGAAYIGSSVLGGMAGRLLGGYFATVFQFMLPNFLAPWSNAILLGGMASIVAGNLAYAYLTNTHGFKAPTLESGLKTMLHVLPYASFFATLYMGFSPMAAFKFTWFVGSICSATLSAEVLYGMWVQPPPKVGTPIIRKPDEKSKDKKSGPMPSPTFEPAPQPVVDPKPVDPKAVPTDVLNQYHHTITKAKQAQQEEKAPKTARKKR